MGGVVIDPIFSLRCVDCDARGEPSRLWLRCSVEGSGGRSPGSARAADLSHDHYVECMNCGAHMKGRADGRMEPVDDDEWHHFVDEATVGGGSARPS